MSSVFSGENIDIRSIQVDAVSQYLARVLPHLNPEDILVVPNATQNTKVSNWFTPQSRIDVPDSFLPKANDTSFCVSYWPPTPVEKLAYRLERYFWDAEDGFAIPRFVEIGQDIKVFVLREGNRIEATLCVPTISKHTTSYEHYDQLLKQHEQNLLAIAEEVFPQGFETSVRINPYQRLYMLATGSCIECGEEGIVGRGNTILGIASPYRPQTQESWAGKNPVYHTGRVMGFLTMKLARAISDTLDVGCCVSTMTRCGDSLIPPRFLGVSLNHQVSSSALDQIIESAFLTTNYLEELLAFRPWLTHL
jgi:S-adenosylmethionine synthetase